MNLPDIQNSKGDFGCSVEAGIRDLLIPVKIKRRDDILIDTNAYINATVTLPKNQRGVHMSRFPINIFDCLVRNTWVATELRPLLYRLTDQLEAESSTVMISFPYFLEKTSPISFHKGLNHVNCSISAMYNKNTGFFMRSLTVSVDVMTLCPCSKEISEANAHNQRANVDITVDYGDNFIWIEELVEIAEINASSGLYPILKRVDEKYVTEKAYSDPVFVEDLARRIANALHADERIHYFDVSVTSEESIHQHNAYANVNSRHMERRTTNV